MGTFRDCIDEQEAAGVIDKATADDTRAAYDAAYAQAAETSGPDQADRAAGKATVEALDRQALEIERRQVLQARRRRAILEGIAEFKRGRRYQEVDALGQTGGGSGGGGEPPKGGWVQGGVPPEDGPFSTGAQAAEALRYLISNRGGLSGGPFPSVEGRYHVVRGRFDAMMADVIEKFETHTGFDQPHRAIMSNVVREAFGEDTGDQAAKGLAKAWGDTAEEARRMFNIAGGDIGRLDRWGLPQSHQADLVYKAGRDAWVDYITPLLDRSKMIDRYTEAAMTEDQLRQALGTTWENIASRGLVNAHPDQRLGAGSTAARRADERFLTFKSADAWMQYQGQFGRSDAFDTMMGHLDGMAKDIAAMQILGPNPAAQFDWLKRMATIEASQERVRQGVQKAEEKAGGVLHHAQAMWDSYTGAGNVPVNSKLAGAARTVRSYLIGAQLGSAILTDMPSAPFFGSIARTFAGIGAKGDVMQLARLLADPEMRRVARRLEFINDTATDGLVSATQDSLRLLSAGERGADGFGALARKLPPFTLRMSGLSGLFEARRRSFRMSFMGAVQDAAASGKTLEQLAASGGANGLLATELRARGFTEAEWGKVGAAEPWEPRPGATFLRPSDIEKTAGFEVAARIGEMVSNMEQYAVPVSGSLWTRASLANVGKPGTIVGEGIRSLALYKTFLINNHILFSTEMAMRAMRAAPDWMSQGVASKAGRVGWVAASTIALTIAGAMTLQLKAIARGEDPMFMGSHKFWGAALLQGGSLGLFGDFLFSKQARTGHTEGVVSGGPIADLIADAIDTGKAAGALAMNPGDEKAQSHAGRQAATDLRKYQPLGSLWWARTAFSRQVLERLQRAVDPEADEEFQAAQERMHAETGQSQWWPKGSPAPARAPDLSAAVVAPDARDH